MMFSSSQHDSGGFSSSQFPDVADAKSRDSHGLIPMTIKQLCEFSHSEDEKANVNNEEVTNVTVVAMVFNKVEKATDVSFILDDGTGRMDTKRWVNEGIDTSEMETIEDGMYVRVNGHLKLFQGVKRLLAFSVRPVSNFDEVTFHFIECIYTHIRNSMNGEPASQTYTVESTINSSIKKGSTEYPTPLLNQLSDKYGSDGLKDSDQLVLACIRQSSDIGQDKGMHQDDVCLQLKLPMEKIRNSLRLLEDEGLIYSTIDEYHYKAT